MSRAPITPNWIDTLPAGPTPLPADPLDRIAAILERDTASDSLHEKRVALGWISPSGEALTWKHWWVRRSQRWN